MASIGAFLAAGRRAPLRRAAAMGRGAFYLQGEGASNLRGIKALCPEGRALFLAG